MIALYSYTACVSILSLRTSEPGIHIDPLSGNIIRLESVVSQAEEKVYCC